MGVRLLQTFVEQHVQGGTYPVNLEEEIRAARKGTEKPLIVIDLMAFYNVFGDDESDRLCGSRIWSIERKAYNFFRRLTIAGAELVFYTDGILPPNKTKTWQIRQTNKYKSMIVILDAIDQKAPLQQIASKAKNIPQNTTINLERVAKQYGKLIFTAGVECDQALAAYAVQYNALAIMSQDSDFLIYPGNWQYWSANYKYGTSLETIGYNRVALLNTLRLQWNQTAVFATLAGNDILKSKELAPFHRSLGPMPTVNNKFHYIATFIRKQGLQSRMKNKKIKEILRCVYRNRPIPLEAEEWFKQSLSTYETDRRYFKPKLMADPMASFLLNNEHILVYSMLYGYPINYSITFFDLRSVAFGKYVDIITGIISRTAGIVLFHKQSGGQQSVLIVTKRSHAEAYAQHTIPAQFPVRVVPPTVEELLSINSNNSEVDLKRKLELLAWVCSDNLPFELFAALPPSVLITIMALFRLVEYGALTVSEADLLLWIAYEMTNDKFNAAAERKPEQLDPRAFRIGFLCQKVYTMCARTAKALGLPTEYRPTMPYDGRRFHNHYCAWRDGRLQGNIQSIADWRLYSEIAVGQITNEAIKVSHELDKHT